MNKKFLWTFVSVLIVATMLLSACAPAAPAATQPPAAPPAATQPPAQPTTAPVAVEPTAAPANTEAPAPTAVPAATGPTKGGQLVWLETGGYYTLDPFVTPWHATPQYAAYDTILSLKPDLTAYVGNLVEDGWKIADDNVTVTFTVRDGKKYQDGTPVTAKSLKWNLDRYLDATLAAPGGGDMRDNFKEIQAPDDKTLVVILKQPYAPLYATLANAEIVSQDAFEKLGPDKFAQAPIGAGPWKVKEIKPDNSILYERFADYNTQLSWYDNKGPVYPDTFLIKYTTDAAVNYAALETGEATIANIPPQFLKQARENKNITIVEGGDTGETYLGFNNQFPPFDNVNVRVAISYAVNRDELVQVGYEGEAIAVHTPLSPAEMGWSQAAEDYGKERSDDVDKCKSMLEAEGYAMGSDNVYAKDGKKMDFVLTTTPDNDRQRMAQALQAQLADCGVKISIDTKESQVVKDMTTKEPKGDYQMMMWGFGLLDPSILTYLYSTTRLGASNRTRYLDPELDKLLVAADQEMNWDKRKADVETILKYLVDKRPMVPLTSTKVYVGYRNDKIGGLKFDKLGGWLYQDAYMITK